MVPKDRAALLLRPAGHQAAGLDAGRSPGTSSPAGSPAARSTLGVQRARVTGNRAARAARLARRARGDQRQPGRCSSPTSAGPERFLNMLRVFKLTSPMSVGSWILSLNGAAIVAAAYGALRCAPAACRPRRRAARRRARPAARRPTPRCCSPTA